MTNPSRTMSRLHQFILIVSVACWSWLGMMLVHELGHVLGALVSGGQVQRVVWHPLTISRTEVHPNPQPLLVVWAGPIVGVLLPLVVAGLLAMLRWGGAYLAWCFAGFCLIANGAYLGLGAIDGIGDAGTMQRLGTPAWVLVAFGLVCAPTGLWLWHRVSPRLGFGHRPLPVNAIHAYASLILAMLLVLVGLMTGNPGS